MQTIIIDDEQGARENLKRYLKSLAPEIKVIAEGENVKKGIEVITSQSPELIFLDVEMPDGSGFDLLRKINQINFKIIFTTAHQKYAIDAFKFSAIDYLLKPIDPEDLQIAIQKANEEINKDLLQAKVNTLLNNLQNQKTEAKKIVLKDSSSIHIIQVTDILRLEASDNYTIFYLNNGQNIVISKTLKEYENLLEGSNFFRVHQSHLINLSALKRYDKKNGGLIIMNDESEIPIAKRRKEKFLKVLNNI